MLSSGHGQGEEGCFWCPLNTSSPSLYPERVHISTPNKYEFQYVQRPLRLTRFDVAVRAHNDARVALSPGPQDTAGMIEIVLGGTRTPGPGSPPARWVSRWPAHPQPRSSPGMNSEHSGSAGTAGSSRHDWVCLGRAWEPPGPLALVAS